VTIEALSPTYSRPAWNETVRSLLTSSELKRYRPALDSVYKAQTQRWADSAVAAEQQVQNFTSRAYGFDSLRSAAGATAAPAAGAAGPWSQFVRSDGKFELPAGVKQGLKQMGLDGPQIAALERKAAEKLKLTEAQAPNFLQGQTSPYQTTEPTPDAPSGEKLAYSKRLLFQKVASALSAKPEASDAEVTAILRAAFGGPNADQLVREFGSFQQAEGSSPRELGGLQGVFQDVAGATEKVPSVLRGPIGQVFRSIQAPGDVVRTALGVLVGAEKGGRDDPEELRKQELTGRDVGAALGNLVKAVPNLVTAGQAGHWLPALKIGNEGTAGFGTIAETADRNTWAQALTGMAWTKLLRQSDKRAVRDLGNITGFVGDVASDPTTYITFGAGGLGTSATRVAGNATSRLATLERLGVRGAEAVRLARTGETDWAKALARLAETHPPDTIKAAEQAGQAARTAAETVQHADGFRGLSRYLRETFDVEADDLFPRASFGPGAARTAAVRGGVGLRGGIPGLRGTQFGVNLRAGSGALHGLRPVSAWWLNPTNAFTQTASKTLDQLAEVFHFGSGSDRAWAHENRGLLNAAMGVGHQADAIRGRGRVFREQIEHAERDLRRVFKGDPQAHAKLTSLIEEGDNSKYAGLAGLGEREHKAIERIRAQIDAARDLAQANGITIAELRELSDDAAVLERYFPHRIRQSLLEGAERRNGPALVGPSKARGLRQGQTLVGPTGAAETLATGSFREVQEVTERLFGVPALEADPFLVAKAYVGAVTQAASVQKLTTMLAERGLIVPTEAGMLKRLSPTSGQVGPGDPIRSVWAAPAQRASALRAEAEVARSTLDDQAAALLGKRADSLERRAQLTETLSQLADRTKVHDAQIEVLTKTVGEQQALRDLAKEQYVEALREATLWHKASRQQTIGAVRAGLSDARESKREVGKAIRQLDHNHDRTVKAITERYNAQLKALDADPNRVKAALVADTRRLGAAVRDGDRSYNDVKDELAAVRDRLAKLEGGDLAAAERDTLYDNAAAALGARRAKLTQAARAKVGAIGELNEQVDLAKREWRHAQMMGKGVAPAYRKLTGLLTQRAELLKQAEALTNHVGDLADTLDAAQAAMRIASLREGTNLVNEVGAVVDIGRGLPEPLREALASLLRAHAADLTAQTTRILADAPRLSFLETAIREFDGPTIGAIGLSPRAGAALGGEVGAYLAEVTRRGDDILASWSAAVGGADKAYDAARAEYTRQWTTILARENDLQERAELAKAADPHAKALMSAQAEGDELNFFEAELHRDQTQLEAWIDNRSELRSTQTLTNLALRAAVKDDKGLRDALHVTQRTLDDDVATAIEHFTVLAADARIFDLMSPQIEHLTAVAGKVPFVNQGYAWPAEIQSVANRLLNVGERERSAFVHVLERFNTFWKRGVLLAPGSAARRITGNVYNAVVLAGVTPESFNKAFRAYSLVKGARSLDEISDPAVRRYLDLAFEHNIFEGQTVAQATTEGSLQVGARHPIQSVERSIYLAALRGEDLARLAQFIEGLDSGMGPEAARLWTGKYHFFNHELTERERLLLRPLYPFYSYLRNNYALQFATLFHQPGRAAVYGYLMRDASGRPQQEGEPNWLTQQGGFPLPLGQGGDQWYLQNTLLDTSPLAAGHALAGLEQEGVGGGYDIQRGDLVSSANPALQVLGGQLSGTNLFTGQNLNEGGAPASGAYTLPGVREGLSALGVIRPDGTVSPRWDMTLSKLLPLLARGQRLGGGGTPSQQEGRLEYAIAQLVGPGLTRNTERAQNAGIRGQIGVVQDLMSRAPDETYPSATDVRATARDAQAVEQIRRLLGG